LQQLAALEKAKEPHSVLPPLPDPDQIGMGQVISIDWSGPIEPIINKLARASHYTLRVLGHHPPIPVLVTITAKNTPLAYVLRDINFQAEGKANIMTYPQRKIIELRYL